MEVRFDFVSEGDETTPFVHRELGTNAVNIDTRNFYDSDDMDLVVSICDRLQKYCTDNNKSLFCFNLISEGLMYNWLSFADKIAKCMITRHNHEPKNFYVLIGAMPDISNVDYYEEACRQFDWLQMGIVLVNSWEDLSRLKTIQNLSYYDNFNNEIKLKSKKFVCYNRSMKPHRLMLCSEMIRRQLLDKSYYSMYLPKDDQDGPYYDKLIKYGHLQHYFPNHYQSIIDTYNSHSQIFPLELGMSNDDKGVERSHRIIDEDRHHWEDSYFMVVTETKFFHDTYDNLDSLRNELSLNGYLISEKTFKCIQGKMPFILAGFTGSLECLRRFGYKTFHPYIDETYDTIVDDEQRLLLIAKEIERLCNLSDQDFLIWQHNVRPILQHNYELLKRPRRLIYKSQPV